MMRRIAISALLGASTLAAQNRPPSPAARTGRLAQPLSMRVAESVMRRNPQTTPRWDYIAGVVLHAIYKVGEARNDPKFFAYVKENMDRWIAADGSIVGYKLDDYNLDQIAQGRLLFPLYARTKDPKYRKAADLLRQQLRTHPRTAEGGFWHKQIYPQQMWLDGLFMAEPFYAEYAKTFTEPAAFDDVAKQFLLVARHTRDPRTLLMYHGWDAAKTQRWADTATGLSANFWGRAIGWYMMGIVETLDYLPPNHPDRGAIIRTLQEVAEGVTRVQDPLTGLWWQVLDQPNRTGNYLETSASAMFSYALAKGSRLGYIDAKYRRVAERAFDGLVTHALRIDSTGLASILNINSVAGLGGNLRRDGSYRDGSFAYYVSEPVVSDDYKGVGPFILAAFELGR